MFTKKIIKKRVLAIGVSNIDFFNLMMTYYPKNLNEDFDIVLFVDNDKNILNEIKDLIHLHNIEIFNNADIIINQDMILDYVIKNKISKKGAEFINLYKACFKLITPIYLKNKYKTENVYAIDDDVFIFKDLTDIFNEYEGWVFKKDNLFILKTQNKHHIIDEFNKIFGVNFSISEPTTLSLNSGTIIYDCEYIDKDYKKHVDNFIESKFIHNMFFNNFGYSAWTLEQRFQQFNMLYLLNHKKDCVEFFKSSEVRYASCMSKNSKNTKQLKKVVPYLIHYAIGRKKPLWLRQFLKGIKWKYPDIPEYQPVKELKGILYNEDWQPDYTKKTKTPSMISKNNSLF